MKLPAVFLVIMLAASAAIAQPATAQPDYKIGPLDVLNVTVWGHTDMTGRYTVESDGTFTFPLIGRVKAADRTLREFESDLRKALDAGYLVNTQVTVAVENYRSQRIFVIGEVRTPGVFPLTGGMSLIEILAQAGTTVSSSSEVVIVRTRDPQGPVMPGQNESAEIIKVNVKDLQTGQMAANIQVRDGDTIFVPRGESAYVFGEVKNSGAFPVGRDTTVIEVLALAGGVNDRGSTSRIRIVRLVDGKKREIKAKLQDRVLPGDTVIVLERFF